MLTTLKRNADVIKTQSWRHQTAMLTISTTKSTTRCQNCGPAVHCKLQLPNFQSVSEETP